MNKARMEGGSKDRAYFARYFFWKSIHILLVLAYRSYKGCPNSPGTSTSHVVNHLISSYENDDPGYTLP